MIDIKIGIRLLYDNYNRETLFVDLDLSMFGVPTDTRFDSRKRTPVVNQGIPL